MQVLAPLLQVYVLHAIKVHKALVDGIAEVCRGFFPNQTNHTASKFAVKLIVGRKNSNLVIWELLG